MNETTLTEILEREQRVRRRAFLVALLVVGAATVILAALVWAL